ncbi:hypothetical protein B1R32_11023 [Abditibacterium utsteinense]|uniref:Alpha-L-rhamnosidase n=1 Tax=Abditibacterium utsteinense TaxID=1960156 RepID=A0A2S8SRY5_9BACT|nr:hypothetical protein [Abditibacterium utsteinense]PQV63560.1 hypothetical protein B1R32_11023 [Abditibacterium utsteinense]
MNDLFSQFLQPSAAFRGKPFWSWNGQLQRDELLRQVHVLQEMGMGGFFMHSRSGLITEYLGDEWFELINACADEAEKLGLEAWLYDEDRWPSGTAAGLVTKNPQFRAHFLRLSTVPAADFAWNDAVFAAFICRLDGQNFADCSRIFPHVESKRLGGETILVFTLEEMEASSFYNGFTYVDTLQRAATDEFIRLTHELYKEKCGDRLGRSIQGIFTDEPHRGPVMNGFGISNPNSEWLTPWTPLLAEKFSENFGADITELLPDLFLQREGEAVSPVKWQYMEVLQQLFLENFARPLYNWCEANNLRLTGHVLHEVDLTSQATMQGSLMRFYEVMHDPGIDILSGCRDKYWAAKQVTSVARQLGQKWILSELYGCTGWERTLSDHRHIGHWQALFGVNVRCHHLSWYTMEGEAKRDYPASIFHQSAWWRDYHHVETYFSRLHVLLAQGEPVCDLLVVTPIESLSAQIHAEWARGLSPQDASVHALEQGYQELFFMLAGAQIDFDYGDEEMMSRLASVTKNETGQAILQVGKARYKAVILGRMTTIRTSTLQLLEEFVAAGGTVIQLGEAAPYVDAVVSQRAVELSQNAIALPWDAVQLRQKCREITAERVEVVDSATGQTLEKIFCQLRRDGNARILVAMNMDAENGAQNALIRVFGAKSETAESQISSEMAVVEWNCLTGERLAVAATQKDGFTEFAMNFAASEQHSFVLQPDFMQNDATQNAPQLELQPERREVARHELHGPFAFELSEPNVCVLDKARFQLLDLPWQDEDEILKVDRAVRSHFERPFRAGDMIQPWFQQKFQPAAREILGNLRLEFEFFIEEIPTQPVFLAIERPELWTIVLNGHALDGESQGWWVDCAFEKIAVAPGALQIGSNVVQLQADFHEGLNLEALYLLGDFGVRLDGAQKTLVKLPETLEIGDLVPQGLPFYGGALTLEMPLTVPLSPGQSAILSAPKFEAACLKVKSKNDHSPSGDAKKLIAWAPYQAEVSDEVASENLCLEVVLTRRNTFGPLHLIPVRADGYGPGNFLTQGAAFSNDYGLIESGLLEAPQLRILSRDSK